MLNLAINTIFSLKNKVAIVTGAARGNGLAIAQGFLKAGASVYFIDLLERELLSLEKEIKSKSAYFIKADVTDFKKMHKIIKHIYHTQKRIDILVNNAGITLPGASEAYSESKWERTHLVNLKSPFMLSQMVAGYMKKHHQGVIINITSISAELGFPNNPAYGAFKGGLKQLSRALAEDWAKYNIRINNLGLGYFKTEMTAGSWKDRKLRNARTRRIMLKRWGEPRDLVGPAIFLASDASRYITGQDLYVDGGWLVKGL